MQVELWLTFQACFSIQVVAAVARHARRAGGTGSKIQLEIRARLLGQVLEVGRQPFGGAGAAGVAQVGEELPVGVHLAVDAQLLHEVLGGDRVDQHALHAAFLDVALVDQAGDEGDRAHLAHQRGVEGDLVDAVEDLGRRPRHLGPRDRVDVHHDDVGRFALVDQREDGGIAHVAAVPVGLAVDLHRLEHAGAGRPRP